MSVKLFPVIDLAATGNNIRRLRMERGLTVRDLQSYFGFEEPRAIYKWQKGESLPTVDNLYALGKLFGVPMDQILVPTAKKLHTVGEQQGEPCCSNLFPVSCSALIIATIPGIVSEPAVHASSATLCHLLRRAGWTKQNPHTHPAGEAQNRFSAGGGWQWWSGR